MSVLVGGEISSPCILHGLRGHFQVESRRCLALAGMTEQNTEASFASLSLQVKLYISF